MSDGPTRSLQFITGPTSPDQTHSRWGITSTDLGVAYADGATTYLAFGDTGKCAPNNEFWRSNVLARTNDRNFGDGLTLTQALTPKGWSADGDAREFIGSRKEDNVEMTTIPTAGIVVDGIHYVDYMSVRHWGAPGQWDTNYAATVTSTDGANWSISPGSVRNNGLPALTPDGSAFDLGYDRLQMAAFVEPHFADEGDYIYRLSTPNGRFGSAYLSRAARAQFPDEDAFEYWDGDRWTSSPADLLLPKAAIFGPRVSELSVTYNSYLNLYVAMYLHEGKGMVVRTAPRLNGPWSAERLLIAQSTIPQLYGGFIVPGQDDQHLYYVMSTFDDYNVYFMRTDLDFALKHNLTTDNITVDEVIN
ncbi:hypothetical protein CPHO_06520 [Corynebacterium phocae]|uniref:DUF4185 domain-containing protein n=1 Tax=Corynebacterium phocae TaxID=161895 RepID=A0A1L7D6Y3_9CORY|nr:hypothetical protein CPHO_06520 [Corynebacterium phocae]